MVELRDHDLVEVFRVAGLPAGGFRAAEIRERFGVSEVRFWQAFTRLIDEPGVYARFPVQCARAQRLRAKRAAERSAGRLP